MAAVGTAATKIKIKFAHQFTLMKPGDPGTATVLPVGPMPIIWTTTSVSREPSYHLAFGMDHDAAGRNWRGAGRIEFVASAGVPGT